MANDYTTYARNLMIDALPSTLYISLHSSDPGQSGNNELAGTTRATINLPAASNGERQANEDFVDIDVQSGQTVQYVGVFDASSGGNFISSVSVENVTFNQDTVYRVTSMVLDLNLMCS